MKFMILIKFALSIALLILIGSQASFAQSNNNGVVANSRPTLYVEDPSKLVGSVDNTNGTVVIDDFTYRLKLNTKVYDQRKRLVNRYALKVGQRVLIETNVERSGRSGPYLDSIFIQSK
jgi:hypothetical protein